jgi:hypothetical protein
MPGYSDYLYPLPGGKLLGVGRDATDQGGVRGLKLALLDVANPAQPRLLDSQVLGEVGSLPVRWTSAATASTCSSQGAQVQVALPVRVTEAARVRRRTPGWQGLARYTADTAAGTW